MRFSGLTGVRVGGNRVSLSGHHWIYPDMSDQRTGGGFACKSNIRITLAYSSDMGTGYWKYIPVGYDDPRQYHSYASATPGTGPKVTPGIYLHYTSANSRFLPAIYPGKIRLWTWYQYQTGIIVFKSYPISIPARYEKNPQNLIPGPVCTGEGPIFRPFLDSRHLSLAGRPGLKARKGLKMDPSPA